MAALPADVPKTDRELLLEVHRDVGYIKTNMDRHDKRIEACEKAITDQKTKWYIIYFLLVIILVAIGERILTGPTTWPFSIP